MSEIINFNYILKENFIKHIKLFTDKFKKCINF